jgi:hypothetical protein
MNSRHRRRHRPALSVPLVALTVVVAVLWVFAVAYCLSTTPTVVVARPSVAISQPAQIDAKPIMAVPAVQVPAAHPVAHEAHRTVTHVARHVVDRVHRHVVKHHRHGRHHDHHRRCKNA